MQSGNLEQNFFAVNSVTLSAFFSTLSTRTVSHIGKSNES
jgi:hypothetical protein